MKLATTGRVFALVLALAGIAATGCKKDKSKPSTPAEVTKKVSRIEENGTTSATFEYNADGTLKKINSTLTPGHTTEFSFQYNAEKKVSEITNNEGFRAKYIYEDGRLRMTENYEDGEKVSENNFQYEAGKIKSNTLFLAFPQGGGNIIYRPVFRSVYSYYANGALQKVSTYELNAVSGELELDHEDVFQQYDSKKNPLSVIADFSQAILYQPIHVNNVLIEKMYDATGEVMETTQNEYTYDALGYPVTLKSTVQPRGGTATVINTKFFY